MNENEGIGTFLPPILLERSGLPKTVFAAFGPFLLLTIWGHCQALPSLIFHKLGPLRPLMAGEKDAGGGEVRCGPPAGRGRSGGAASGAGASVPLFRPHAFPDPAPPRALRTPRRGWRRFGSCGRGLTPSAPSPPSPRRFGPGAPPRLMGRVGRAGRVSDAGGGVLTGGLAGSRGGSASLGGAGREAAALGRARQGGERSRAGPREPPTPSVSRLRAPGPGCDRPAVFPLAPAAFLLYLSRVTGPLSSSCLLPILPFPICVFPLSDPSTLWWCFFCFLFLFPSPSVVF